MRKAIGVIPARYVSKRFPGKALASLLGKPIIQHTYERAKGAKSLDYLVVATDDDRIYDCVRSFGGNALMTSAGHPTGTDRIAEVVSDIDCETVVNIQGDEPLLKPEVVDSLVESLSLDKQLNMSTAACSIESPEELRDTNIVKVVTDNSGFALYFSRAPIPYSLNNLSREASRIFSANSYRPLKHIGVYAYRKDFLLRFAKLPQTPLETQEHLEQLRALENGEKIRVTLCDYHPVAINLPEDISKVAEILRAGL
jgi:3-deoxy-manno-octulosonate cytidylyltransferase (CMP-KDO synthetase)